MLQKYGNLENVYKHLGEIPEKQAQKLAEGAEAAGLAKKLAQIVLDAPIKLDLNKAATEKIDKQGLINFFREYGFKSLLERLNKESITKEREEKTSSKNIKRIWNRAQKYRFSFRF